MNVLRSKCRNPMNKIYLMCLLYFMPFIHWHSLCARYIQTLHYFVCFNLSHSIHLCVFYLVRCLSFAASRCVCFFFLFSCFHFSCLSIVVVGLSGVGPILRLLASTDAENNTMRYGIWCRQHGFRRSSTHWRWQPDKETNNWMDLMATA